MRNSSPDSLSLILSLINDGMFSVDGDGIIWRHKIRTRWGCRDVISRRADHISPIGYRYVSVTIDGKQTAVPAHRVVWSVLCGAIPVRMEVNHKDGNRANNQPSNLELVTSSENKMHSYRVLGHKRTGPYKWGPRMQAEVLRLRKAGFSYRRIEAQTGVSTAAARHIVSKALSHQGRRGENDAKAVELLLVNERPGQGQTLFEQSYPGQTLNHHGGGAAATDGPERQTDSQSIVR